MMDDDPLDLEVGASQTLTTMRVILIAALVALIVGCVPALSTALIVNSNLKAGQQAIVEGRVRGTRENCLTQNRIVDGVNRQTDTLNGLIVQSARQRRPGETDEAFKQRQQEGFRAVKILSTKKLKHQDCQKEAARVQSEQ